MIAAVHPGLWQPAVLAKLGATADQLSNGRFAVNVVSGWFKDEFTHLGEPWLEHDERYRRSAEFLQVLRELWTNNDPVEFRGNFYRIHDFTLKPKPVNTPERPNPELFQGGNSTADKRGMWADSTFEDLVQYNDGFRTQLIGTPEQGTHCGVPQTGRRPYPRWLSTLLGGDLLLRVAGAAAGPRDRERRREVD